MTTAIAYLTVDDGAAALDFYARAFGAEVTERYDDDGRLGHATLAIDDAFLFISDEFHEYGAIAPKTLGGSTAAVVLIVADVDATYGAAVEAGAHPQRPVGPAEHGARGGWIVDPFGHRWNIRSEG